MSHVTWLVQWIAVVAMAVAVAVVAVAVAVAVAALAVAIVAVVAVWGYLGPLRLSGASCGFLGFAGVS